jgi:uncharacterized protein
MRLTDDVSRKPAGSGSDSNAKVGAGRAAISAARPGARREAEPAGAMASAFAKLKR